MHKVHFIHYSYTQCYLFPTLVSDQILSAVVFTDTLSWGLRQFFPIGTYAGIGTMCVEFKNVIKSATKKKKKKSTDL